MEAGSRGPLALRAPRHLVSPRAIWYWTVRAGLGWLLLAGIQVAWLLAGGGAAHLAGLAATALAALAHLTVMPRWRYRVHRWEATPDAVYTRSGWLRQEWRIAPLSRIQTVDSERGPLERIFRLANVTVTTASAAGPVRIHGLDQAAAGELLEELTARTGAGQADAT